MPVKPTPKPNFNTLTTSGRVAKAAHERATMEEPSNAAEQTAQPPQPPIVPTIPKKRKIPTLPPPHEKSAEAEAKKALAKSNPKSKKKTPLTTKEKLAENAAIRARENKRKQPVVHDGVGLQVVKGGGWGRVVESDERETEGKKAPVAKPRNLMDIMRDLKQVPTAAAAAASGGQKGRRFGGGRAKAARESVLVRPTERTKRLKADVHQPDHLIVIKREHEYDASAGSRLMALPLEVRQWIWRLAVVETHFFVWPAISTEQPDLAMTSRQIRGEVLPLYYGENTIAVEFPVEMGRRRAFGHEPLEPVKKWTAALEEGGHVGTIKKWAFSLVLPAGAVLQPSIDQEVLISLQYPKSDMKKHVQPKIEIHRQAVCLLPTHEEYRQCVQMGCPQWIHDALAAAFLAGKHDRGKQMVLFAGSIERKGCELGGCRCVREAEVAVLEDD